MSDRMGSDGPGLSEWVLDDGELEALMGGATPADLARSGNPVAEFFTDARSDRAIGNPRPSPPLQRLFASEGITDPTLRPGSGWSTEGQRIGPRPRVERPVVRPRPDPPRPQQLGSPDLTSPDLTSPIAFESTPSRRSEHRLQDAPLLDVRRQPRTQVIRRAPVELIQEVVRPTGPKLLMLLALAALVLAVGPAAGLFELPLGGGGVANQATEGTSATVEVAAPEVTEPNGSLFGADPRPPEAAELPAPDIPPADPAASTGAALATADGSTTVAATPTTSTTRPTTTEATTTTVATTASTAPTTTEAQTSTTPTTQQPATSSTTETTGPTSSTTSTTTDSTTTTERDDLTTTTEAEPTTSLDPEVGP